MLRHWICLAVLVGALGSGEALVGEALAAAAPGKAVAGIRLPPRSRSQPHGSFKSSRSFQKTVVYFQRYLKRRGILHKQIPTRDVRGVQLSRFLSLSKKSTWSAIHVYRIDGVTHIFVVPTPKAASE